MLLYSIYLLHACKQPCVVPLQAQIELAGMVVAANLRSDQLVPSPAGQTQLVTSPLLLGMQRQTNISVFTCQFEPV